MLRGVLRLCPVIRHSRPVTVQSVSRLERSCQIQNQKVYLQLSRTPLTLLKNDIQQVQPWSRVHVCCYSTSVESNSTVEQTTGQRERTFHSASSSSPTTPAGENKYTTTEENSTVDLTGNDNATRKGSVDDEEPRHWWFFEASDPETEKTIIKNMNVYEEFLTTDEELAMMEEIEPYIKRLHYEFDHWDDAIHAYRETEKKNWSRVNRHIIQRVRELAFPPGEPQLQYVHVLDLHETGYIKPHIDSVKFCGSTIAGLCLLSDSVMKLVNEDDSSKWVKVLLRKRSLYIMQADVRYKYTHAILSDKESYFKDMHIPRARRVSVMCRNEPHKH